jgi:hypothetical protein
MEKVLTYAYITYRPMYFRRHKPVPTRKQARTYIHTHSGSMIRRIIGVFLGRLTAQVARHLLLATETQVILVVH